MRDKVGVYEKAGFPNYPAPNADGYPERVDVSRRLAIFFAGFPDYYETFRPKLDGPFVPAVSGRRPELRGQRQVQGRARRHAQDGEPAAERATRECTPGTT